MRRACGYTSTSSKRRSDEVRIRCLFHRRVTSHMLKEQPHLKWRPAGPPAGRLILFGRRTTAPLLGEIGNSELTVGPTGAA
jgi:hypothetical protein